MNDITIAVKTCERYKDTRLKSCEETWLSNDDVLVGDLDELDVVQGYQGLIRKTKRFFLNHNLKTKWLFWCDDDTFVNRERLKDLCDSMDASNPILTGRGTMATSPRFKYNHRNNSSKIARETIFGAGMLISRPMFYLMQTSLFLNRPVDILAHSSEDQWLCSIAWDLQQLFGMHTGNKKNIIYEKRKYNDLFALGMKDVKTSPKDYVAIFQLSCDDMRNIWNKF